MGIHARRNQDRKKATQKKEEGEGKGKKTDLNRVKQRQVKQGFIQCWANAARPKAASETRQTTLETWT